MNWKSLISELTPFYSQREIAEHAGLAESAVSRMKRGLLHRVSYEAGCKIMEMVVKTRRRKRRPA